MAAGKKYTEEEFIEKSKSIHNNKYDYSLYFCWKKTHKSLVCVDEFQLFFNNFLNFLKVLNYIIKIGSANTM